jgi:hypothetical protein
MIVRSDLAVGTFGAACTSFEQALSDAARAEAKCTEPPLLWLRRLPRHLTGVAARRFWPPVLVDEQVRISIAAPERTWYAATSVGGREGYPIMQVLWRIRGAFDRMIGGPGLNRHGPSGIDVGVGDTLDFWRVVELDPAHRLRMIALMKVPGRAELELAVHPSDGGGSVLVQTARFKPRGLLGRLYWWALYPVHLVIFAGMATRTVRRAESV